MLFKKKQVAQSAKLQPAPVVPPDLEPGQEALTTLPGGGRILVQGEEYHQDAIRRASKARKPGVPRVDRAVAQLVPEPTNPHDRYAIAVVVGHELVGYIAQGTTRYVRSAMEACIAQGLPATCVAHFITGGPIAKGMIGVTVDAQMDRNTRNER